MAFQPVKARCRNCKKFYTKTRENQTFCKKKCRDNFHNYGKTPLEQVTRRFKAWMRTPDFKELMRDAVSKEFLRQLRCGAMTVQTVQDSIPRLPGQ